MCVCVSFKQNTCNNTTSHYDGLVQDYSISIAKTLEILQSYTKPSI